MFFGKIYNLLQSVNVGSKRCDDKSSFCVIRKKPVESFADDVFAHRVTFLLDVCRFAKKKSNASFADFRYSRNIYHFPVYGSQVDFEIARMINKTRGSVDRQRATSRDRMVYVNEFDRKTSEFYDTRRLYAIKRISRYSLLYKLMLAKHQSEFRSVNGNVDLF